MTSRNLAYRESNHGCELAWPPRGRCTRNIAPRPRWASPSRLASDAPLPFAALACPGLSNRGWDHRPGSARTQSSDVRRFGSANDLPPSPLDGHYYPRPGAPFPLKIAPMLSLCYHAKTLAAQGLSNLCYQKCYHFRKLPKSAHAPVIPRRFYGSLRSLLRPYYHPSSP